MKTRLKEILDNENMSPSAFADAIHFNQSNLSKVLSGKRNVPAGLTEAIIRKFPKYNPQWILTGKGNMLNSPSDNDGVIVNATNSYNGDNNNNNITLNRNDDTMECAAKYISQLERQMRFYEEQNSYLRQQIERLYDIIERMQNNSSNNK